MQVFELKNAICVHFYGKSNMSKIFCLGFEPGGRAATYTHKKSVKFVCPHAPKGLRNARHQSQ